MSRLSDTINIGRLALSAGEARRFDLEVRPGALDYGGQRYEAGPESDGRVSARLDVTRTVAGYALRLRFRVAVAGPCVRCLEPAELPLFVDAREIDQPGSDSDELTSPYVDGDELDLRTWAHDALALTMPDRFLCRPDCAGLCPVCGESLNDVDAAEHQHEAEPDPRWAKLRELKLE
jgi:uncharacterized protein